jgi:hypothetical protein
VLVFLLGVALFWHFGKRARAEQEPVEASQNPG